MAPRHGKFLNKVLDEIRNTNAVHEKRISEDGYHEVPRFLLLAI